jgi:hypothetical protein
MAIAELADLCPVAVVLIMFSLRCLRRRALPTLMHWRGGWRRRSAVLPFGLLLSLIPLLPSSCVQPRALSFGLPFKLQLDHC